MSGKKKFKDTKVGQFLLEKIPNVVGSLAGDTPVGNVIRTLIGGSELSEADKQIALKKLEQEIHEFDGVTKRWVADSQSDSWLSKNVRPATLIFLTISLILGWAYQLEELNTISELVKIVFISYFGSRGVEKVFGNNKHK